MARAVVALVLTLALAGCTDGNAPPQLTSGDAGLDQGIPGDLAGTLDLAGTGDLAGTCKSACDCPAGQACRARKCEIVAAPVYCCTAGMCTGPSVCEYPNGTFSQCDRRDAGAITPVVDGGIATTMCEMTGCSKGAGSDAFCRLACGGPATCVGTGGNQHCMP